jgi:hypothetical protein
MKITESRLRRIIKKTLVESRPDLSAASRRNKPYIMSDESLYYWLRQNMNPLSIDHYSLEPYRMHERVIDLIENNSFLSGFRCIGQVMTYMKNYSVYLFANRNEYTVVCINHSTDGLITAKGIPRSDYELLVELIKYMSKKESGNSELEQYIFTVN